MERVNERVDIIKVFEYVIQNIMILNRKGKVEKVKVVLKNDLIHIDIDDCIYTLSNVIMYRKFIDKISYKYKVLLKYMPLYDNLIMKEIALLNYNNNQVTVVIKNKKLLIE